MKTNKQTKQTEAKEKTVIVDLFKLANIVTSNEELMAGLSDYGKETVKKAIHLCFFSVFGSDVPLMEFRSWSMSRTITMNILKNMELLPFTTADKIYHFIGEYLDTLYSTGVSQ